jgi:hypothetical protein
MEIDRSVSETRSDPMVTDYGMPADGWVLFAGLMILFAGLWNVFEGMIGLFRSAYFIGSPVFGSLWIWALLWTVFGLFGLAAGAAILSGQTWGRWFGIVVVSLNALVQLASVGAYPWWSLAMVAVDIFILYALTARWGRATGEIS